MTVFVALIRAVNVGGTGKLPMKDLLEICEKAGFENARTYIQSGNVVFDCGATEKSVRTRLEKDLTSKVGKAVDVFVRTATELQAVLRANPFPGKDGAKVGILFQADKVDKSVLKEIVAPGGEAVRIGRREIYVYYPRGMGRSNIKLPKVPGTMRNVNTVAKLVELATAGE